MTENQAKPRRRVLLTTDCGADMDDQWALSLLALSPEFDLCGVVTTHAPNFDTEATARVAREVLDHMPLAGPHPPVIPGSSQPLESRTAPRRNPGVDFILQVASKNTPQDRLTLLSIGAATDVASALLVDPTLGDRIEIVAMGFLSWPEGGLEFNIQNDLKAWQVLLASTAPITVGDQTVCKKDLLMTPQRAYTLFDGSGAPGHYLAKMLDDYIARDPAGIAACSGKPNHWPIWDCVTVAYLLGMTQHQVYPRPALNDELKFVPAEDPAMAGRTLGWITDVDSDRLWALFAERLKGSPAGVRP